MENYIVINGKKAELTEEQLIKLGIKPDKNKYEEMFHQELHADYYFINANGNLGNYMDDRDIKDNMCYNAGNYCKDKTVMKQRALHETLSRRLWRASILAGEMDNPWEVHTKHYYIYKSSEDGVYRVWYNDSDNAGLAYFPTERSAKDAIEDIIKPFMKEHPEFIW